MKRVLGSINFLFCFMMLFCYICAGQGADINIADSIKVAYESLPLVDEAFDYSDEELELIKSFVELWETADQETKDYVHKNYNINNLQYYNCKNLYSLKTKSVDISLCNIAPINDCVFNGTNHTPVLSVVFSGNTLELNKDFSVEYTNNTKVGVAAVKINGIGKYFGSKTQTFNIVPAKITEACLEPISNKTYTGKKIAPNFKITFGNYQLVKDVDYKISYLKNKNVGIANVVVKGFGNFNGETKTTFKIDKKAISKVKVFGIRTKIFKGNVIVPKIKVKTHGKFLKEGIDYNLSVSGNQRVGFATVRISAIGNYKGKLVKYFKILPARPKKVTYSSSGILRWNEVQGVEKYEIRYSKFRNMKKAKTVVVSENSYVNLKLKGKYIKIIAIKKIGDVVFKSKPLKTKIQ